MKRLVLAVVLLACSGLAAAACPGHVVCIEWRASTGWSDGTPFAAGTVPLYKVYRRAKDGGPVTMVLSTTALEATLTNEPRGSQCYVVTATVDGKESLYSNEGCKLVRIAAPTDGSIEAPSEGAIEPK